MLLEKGESNELATRDPMKVRVKMLGVLGRRNPGQEPAFELALHGNVTAGDLLRVLAERCGSPFRDVIESPDVRLPSHIRMFSDGEMLATMEQPLIAKCVAGASVTVVFLSPMMGG